MDSNNELKVIDIKNRTWYYFDEIIKIESSDPDNILIDKKLFENVLFYNISLKSLIDSEPLRIRFDKIYGFTRVYDGTKYLLLFGNGKYDSIYNRIRYLMSLKFFITYIISHIMHRKNNDFS